MNEEEQMTGKEGEKGRGVLMLVALAPVAAESQLQEERG